MTRSSRVALSGKDGFFLAGHRVSCCALALAVGLVAGGARAQSQEDAPESGGAETAEPIEQIVVTAKRRSEDLQTTGVSGTVLTGSDLVDKSVEGLVSLQYAAPSVTITDYGSANVFNIRGIGRSQVDVDLPSGVVIYRDGAPTLAGYFQNEPYFDMNAIEVLRGPQGTFSGKSAAGGAVFISTRSPELGLFGGQAEVGIGDFQQREFTGVVNLPIGEEAAARLAYHHSERDDYYDHIGGVHRGDPGIRDHDSFRIGLRWAPTPELDLVLKTDVSHLDFGGNVVSSFGDDLFDVEQNGNLRYTDDSVRVVLDAKYELGNGIVLSSLSGYQDVDTVNNLDLNGTQDPFYVFNSAGDIEIISQEFNLISPGDQRLRWVLGAFYQKQEIEIPTWQDGGFTFTGFPGPDVFPVASDEFPWITTPWDKDEDDWALFAHLAYDLRDDLELEIGIRHSDYETEQFTEWTFGFGNTPPIFPFGSPGGDRQELDEKSLDGTIGLNWVASDAHFLYALVSRGHVTSGINLFPPFLEYDEMEVFNYEAGWKATWADGLVRTQLSAFYETFDDYQALFAQPGIGLAAATFRNAQDESEIWGVELSGQAVLGALSVDLGVAYLDSELGTFKGVEDPFRVDDPSTPELENLVDLSGAESPFSPEFTGNVGAQYTFELDNGVTLTPRLDYAHISDTQAGLWDSPLIELEDRDLLNVQVILEWSEWWARAWMTNATNKEYVGGIQNNGTLRYAGPPRQFGLRVGRTF